MVPYDKNLIMVESARTLHGLACPLAGFEEELDVLMTQLYPSMESSMLSLLYNHVPSLFICLLFFIVNCFNSILTGINMHSDLLNLVPQSPVVTLR